MIRSMKNWLLAGMASLALVACGGGGGDPGACALCGGGDDGGGGDQVVVSSLLITLDKQSVSNGGADTITATITALDSNRVALAGADIEVSVDEGAVATVSSATSDESGVVTAVVAIGTDKANRVVTLRARSGTVEETVSFQVTGSRISASYTGTVSAGSVGNQITFLVTDVNGVALGNREITVSAPGLTSETGTTDDTGRYVYTYTAPAVAGELTFTASSAGVSADTVVAVQSVGVVPNAVGPIGSASLAMNPNTVSVNAAGASTNQAQIRALFVRPDNSAIRDVRVRFDLAGDPNQVGGAISTGSSMLYSTSNGVVTAAYVPGTRSSPTDGVTVRACYSLTDFPAGTCPSSVTATLTVTDAAISVTLGTNALIQKGESDLTYIKQFVAMVADSAGNAMPGVTITPVVDLTDYAKGSWAKSGSVWEQGIQAVCANEDADRDGILDAEENDGASGSGVVDDGDGVLEPRKADVTIRMVGSNKTDASGLAVLQIEYPQNVASWVAYQIAVTASGVSGTEGRATFTGVLPVDADASNDVSTTPPFIYSPYGLTPSCTTH